MHKRQVVAERQACFRYTNWNKSWEEVCWAMISAAKYCEPSGELCTAAVSFKVEWEEPKEIKALAAVSKHQRWKDRSSKRSEPGGAGCWEKEVERKRAATESNTEERGCLPSLSAKCVTDLIEGFLRQQWESQVSGNCPPKEFIFDCTNLTRVRTLPPK